ncbi:hypothetical protein [Ruminococcus flavefaciens]|uniref:hypothetical protein n=1 Tax=Ruminococcus flavefaciens TaxID=1265 RepID=UPI0026F1FF78|nr:hypothetical protein [Ruminococcus flavefaciens]
MRSYEEISNRIMERGDKLIESAKVRAAKIRHTSYAVSGMCAAAIAGIGVWHIASYVKKPDDGFNGSGIVSATETITENTSSAEITTALTTTSPKATAAAKTTKVTTDRKNSDTTSAVPAVTTAAVQTTSAKTSTVHVTTSGNNADETAIPESPAKTTTADDPTPVTTTVRPVSPDGNGNGNSGNSGEESVRITTSVHIEDGPTTTSASINETSTETITTAKSGPQMGDGGYVPPTSTTTTSLQDVFRANPSYITLNGVRYEKQAEVSVESIGSYLHRVDVHIMYIRQNIRSVMKAYLIEGVDEVEAVAVQLKDTDEYYLFRNTSYKKDEDE